MKKLTLALALIAAVPSLAGPSAPLAQAAEGKPIYRVAQDLEAEGPDGKWYAVKVQRVDKKQLKYLVKGPLFVEAWVEEAKLRTPTGDVAKEAPKPAAPTPAAPTAPTPAAPDPASWKPGQSVEVQANDGRWYAATVEQVKPGEVLAQLVNFPKGGTWFKADRVRAKGGGEIVDPEYVKGNLALREKFGLSKAFMEQAKWGDAEWEANVKKMIDLLVTETDELEKRWPKENYAPMREGIAFRKKEYDEKHKVKASSAAALSAEEATAMAEHYKKIFEAVRYFPANVVAGNIVDAVEAFEALRLTELDARIAADKAKAPGVFKYYGSEEKGRFADLEYGGPQKPALAPPALNDINTHYLRKIFEAKARVLAGEAELAKGVRAAIDRGPSLDRAQQALRLARAFQGCRPTAPGLAEALAAAEANLARAEAAEKAAAAPKPASPAPAAPKPGARPKSPVVDASKIDSGVELTFSSGSIPGSKAASGFTAGEFIFAHAKFPEPVVKALVRPVVTDSVFFTLFLSVNGEELEYTSIGVRTTHLFGEQSAGQAGALVLPIVSNPEEDCFVYANNLFNYTTWEALASLPPGEHSIDARLESSAPKVEGVPLAVAKLKLKVTPEGIAAWKQNAKLVEKAFYARGGEIVKLGLQVEGPDGFKIVTRKGGVRTTYRHGRFEGNDFWIGIGLFGRKGSDHYTPSGGQSIFVKRVEGGFQVERGGTALLKFHHDGSITDRNGKPWGKVTNEWDTVFGVGDLLDLVAGLHHFGDVLR